MHIHLTVDGTTDGACQLMNGCTGRHRRRAADHANLGYAPIRSDVLAVSSEVEDPLGFQPFPMTYGQIVVCVGLRAKIC